ncbi:MAG: chromosomal replication initiator protein DnaA [Candidatus Niyogibacteria bacterium CG10_big_fil_rev_8_21_14_0_10_42_19]|uniref:Chromosomal replication initiator protein DnaA n=1 Tax=Candidatus Niyogibacteria bacterium CG10_big_fil_rev_8_21_14_0_10_42_19 TaxID=1974725 RepID=A0A2H0TF55_9BACT|nr:MAG: chromosomal replication initiator protein DnaA [Candidatus Niyogibacteria bacterium CG10_big_fil_rev_8_21_14_0_10_42_19]
MTNEELWGKALTDIESDVSKANFITWFKNTAICDRLEGEITVGVPNAFVKEWLEHKYHIYILKALRNHAPETRNVAFSIIPRLSSDATKPLHEPQNKKYFAEEQPEISELVVDRETNLNSRYTFDNFVVGSFNELAHAASKAVTKNLGTLYNPLFIYGGVGLGKTHLLQSIGNEIKKSDPNLKIKYISSEKFTNEFISALQNSETASFKEKYRAIDLLIIDDIQFIAKKIQTQEEVFHTFNTLYEKNKQIVFSSDRPPKSIENIEERLRSRFEGGMITDISEPEYEARFAILKTKAAEKNLAISDEILSHIATIIQSNIRELEGALNSVIARSNLLNKTLNTEEIKNFLSKNIKPKRIATAQQIIQTVASFYNIPEKHLFEKSRRKEIVKPRQIAMFLLREDFNGSYPYIGQKFGGRDHTTAIHSYDKICKELKKSEQLTEEIRQIRSRFYNNGE